MIFLHSQFPDETEKMQSAFAEGRMEPCAGAAPPLELHGSGINNYSFLLELYPIFQYKSRPDGKPINP
jgi:hypothetical protein